MMKNVSKIIPDTHVVEYEFKHGLFFLMFQTDADSDLRRRYARQTVGTLRDWPHISLTS